MFGLIPKEEKFFKLFKNMTENIIDGAKLLEEAASGQGREGGSDHGIHPIRLSVPRPSARVPEPSTTARE